MPKEIPNKRYIPEFKKLVVERCGQSCTVSGTLKKRKPKLNKQAEENLIAKVQDFEQRRNT